VAGILLKVTDAALEPRVWLAMFTYVAGIYIP
jgi:hypothetical protein